MAEVECMGHVWEIDCETLYILVSVEVVSTVLDACVCESVCRSSEGRMCPEVVRCEVNGPRRMLSLVSPLTHWHPLPWPPATPLGAAVTEKLCSPFQSMC